MTEEVKQEVVEQSKQEENKTPEISSIEQHALEMGWKPRTEFDGSEDEFIDAKEFVRRKPLFDRLEQQSKQIKQVNKALEALKGHYSKMREVEFQRALTQLKDARKQAINDNDGDRFEAINDQIVRVETEAKQVLDDVQPTNAPDPAEFNHWISKNTWYQKDEAMTAFADRIGMKLKSDVDNGELTALQVLQKVEKAVREEFPHKFRNPNKESAPQVGEGRQASTKKVDNFQLDETERKIMETFVRQGIMTKDDYIKDLKKLKGL